MCRSVRAARRRQPCYRARGFCGEPVRLPQEVEWRIPSTTGSYRAFCAAPRSCRARLPSRRGRAGVGWRRPVGTRRSLSLCLTPPRMTPPRSSRYTGDVRHERKGGMDVDRRPPMRCCARRWSRPSEIALQGEVSNHRKLRRSRAGVANVGEKASPVRGPAGQGRVGVVAPGFRYWSRCSARSEVSTNDAL
jgi:hypothetical protein